MSKKLESQEELGPSEALDTKMPRLVPPIRVQVGGEVLDLGTPKFNDVAKIIGQVTIDFLQMGLTEVYALQKDAVVKIKVR